MMLPDYLWQVLPAIVVGEMYVAAIVASVCGRWWYACYWLGGGIVNTAAIFIAQGKGGV